MKYLLVEHVQDSESGYEEHILFDTREEVEAEIKSLREDPSGGIEPIGVYEISKPMEYI